MFNLNFVSLLKIQIFLAKNDFVLIFIMFKFCFVKKIQKKYKKCCLKGKISKLKTIKKLSKVVKFC